MAALASIGGLATLGAARSAGFDPMSSTPQGLLPAPLRVGYLPITDAAALLLAHENGHFAQAGVASAEPVLFRGWDALVQALVVGEIDVAHLLLPLAVQARLEDRLPARVVSWAHRNGSALTVAPGITSVEDLAGTRVAVPAWWSVHNVLLQQMLTRAGLRPLIRGGNRTAASDVEIAVMPPAEMVAALAGGRISGFVVAEPFSSLAAAKGAGHTLRYLGDVWRAHGCCALVVRDSLIDERPDAVQAIVDSVVTAGAWAQDHRGQVADVLTGSSALMPQPAAVVSEVLVRDAAPAGAIVAHPQWHGHRLDFEPFPRAGATAALAGLMRRTEVDGPRDFLRGIADDEVHAHLVDDRFVTEALSRAGRTPDRPANEEITP